MYRAAAIVSAERPPCFHALRLPSGAPLPLPPCIRHRFAPLIAGDWQAVYEALKRQDITARKAGRRTLISFADLEAYLASLPTYQAGA